MKTFFQFIGPWGSYVAFSAASVTVLLWMLSHDDNERDKKVISALLWATFWRVRWLYCRITGKDVNFASSRILPSRRLAFRTVREAKDYLATTIADEAQCAGTPLTTVERKMLYFTETGWTLPDMKEVSAEFDREYDHRHYELKIGELTKRVQIRLATQRQEEQERWNAALEKLSQGDHYLFALVRTVDRSRKGLIHNLKMLIIALAFLVYAAMDTYFRHWMRDH